MCRVLSHRQPYTSPSPHPHQLTRGGTTPYDRGIPTIIGPTPRGFEGFYQLSSCSFTNIIVWYMHTKQLSCAYWGVITQCHYVWWQAKTSISEARGCNVFESNEHGLASIKLNVWNQAHMPLRSTLSPVRFNFLRLGMCLKASQSMPAPTSPIKFSGSSAHTSKWILQWCASISHESEHDVWINVPSVASTWTNITKLMFPSNHS